MMTSHEGMCGDGSWQIYFFYQPRLAMCPPFKFASLDMLFVMRERLRDDEITRMTYITRPTIAAPRFSETCETC